MIISNCIIYTKKRPDKVWAMCKITFAIGEISKNIEEREYVFMKFNAVRMRFAAVGLSVLVVLSVSGCRNTNDGKVSDYTMDPVLNELGSETICKEKVELEFMLAQSGSVVDYDTNKYTLQLEKKGNVDIKFNLLPTADAESKINLVLSSGTDLPDVLIRSMDTANVATYGESGVFVPLNTYYENSSEYLVPQLEKYKEETGTDLLKYITMSDGNIYCVPSYCETLMNEIPGLLWVYKPWLEKLNLKAPENLNEFVDVLKAFRDKDANGNGNAADEIPLVDYTEGTLLTVLEQAFVRTGEDDLIVDKDGKLGFAYMTDEYKEFLKYVKTLVDERLLDKTTFSQDIGTWKTLLNSEVPKVGFYCQSSTSVLTAGTPRRGEFAPVFLDNGDNKTLYYKKTIPDSVYFITKDCEHPEVAFRIADYMCDRDVTISNRWGEKGVDYKVPDSSAKSMFEFMGYKATIQPVLEWGKSQNSHWCNVGAGFRTNEVSLGVVNTTDLSQLAKADAIKLLYNRYGGKDFIPKDGEIVYKIIYTTEELDERSQILNVIDSYVSQARYDFITGKKDIDKDWNSYISELKSSNAERLLEISQEAYDRMNEE